MTLQEILSENPAHIALAKSIHGERLNEIAFKIFCVRSLLEIYRPGEKISADELIIVLEDFDVPIGAEDRIELAIESGIIERVRENGYQISESIPLTRPSVTNQRSPRPGISVGVNALFELLKPPKRVGTMTQARPSDCLDAVARSWVWTVELISYCLREGIRGVPVFWPRDYGYLQPMGRDVGTTSTLDAFLVLFAPTMHGLSNDEHRELLNNPVVLDYLDLILSMQRQQEGWLDGAFALDGYDDDFVGAFVPPEQCPDCPPGPCPTVDGTAIAVLLYALVARSKVLNLPSDVDRRNQLRAWLANAVQKGVQFLLRTQLPTGAWGVYRYENDEHPIRPRELACRIVVEAFAEIRTDDLLDSSADAAVATAVTRYVEWALKTRQESADGVFWTPEFTRKDVSDSERFPSTVWVASSLLFAIRGWPEHRSAVEPLLQQTVDHLIAHWTPNRSAFGATEVRAATWKGPAIASITWELPIDPMVVSLLTSYYRETETEMPGEAWSKVNQAVASFLADEEQGHWVDFLMSREGNYRAMPSNTLHYNRALLDYLHYLRDAVNGLFDDRTGQHE